MKITREIAWGVVISIVTIIIFVSISSFIGEEAIKNVVKSAGVWAPISIILLKILTIVIAPISGFPLYVMAGSLFGVGKGFY